MELDAVGCQFKPYITARCICMLVAPLWCDLGHIRLGCCSGTVMVLKLQRTPTLTSPQKTMLPVLNPVFYLRQVYKNLAILRLTWNAVPHTEKMSQHIEVPLLQCCCLCDSAGPHFVRSQRLLYE